MMNYIENNKRIKSLFTTDEIDMIKKTTRKDRQHPLKRLLFPRKDDLQVVTNTENALKHIIKNNKDWIKGIKKRLLNTADYSESSSALGELRAYGYMLEGGFNVLPATTPDFIIDDKQKIYVEVHSKQINKEEAEALEDFNNKKINIPKKHGSVIRHHEVTPCGVPKKGENVTENVISKLTNIKSSEHQLSKNDISILWLDFQDEIWTLSMRADLSFPIVTWNSEIFSGPLWYCFYGWQGAPIFERFYPYYPSISSTCVKMRHKGRFISESNADFAIVSLLRNTIIFENPNSKKEIDYTLWLKVIELPFFNLEYSWLNWPAYNLNKRIEKQKEIILSLERLRIE